MFEITSTSASGGRDSEPPGATTAEHHAEHHRSVWPIVGALGAAGLYVGVALLFLAYSAGTVPSALGVAVAVGGALVATVGLFGWLQQAFLSRYTVHEGSLEDRRLHVTTMVLFLATDLGTFGAGIIYYVFVRVGTWPPAELPPLLGSLVIINTAILLASSVTFHGAHVSLERGNRRRFVGLLGLTVVLGTTFLAGQAFEYYEFIVVEGFTIGDGVFASAFFGLTGLHGLHVALGVVLLGIVFVRAIAGHYGPDRDTSVTTVGLYWHFVDAVWIGLVVILYVGAGASF